MTVGENFYSGRKENDSQSQLFITMQPGFFPNSINSTLNQLPHISQTQNNTLFKYKGNLKTDQKWTF